VIHLRKIAIKPVLYFRPQLFSAPLLYLVTQATNLIDIHSDKHYPYKYRRWFSMRYSPLLTSHTSSAESVSLNSDRQPTYVG